MSSRRPRYSEGFLSGPRCGYNGCTKTLGHGGKHAR